jgi:hypothetical protein
VQGEISQKRISVTETIVNHVAGLALVGIVVEQDEDKMIEIKCIPARNGSVTIVHRNGVYFSIAHYDSWLSVKKPSILAKIKHKLKTGEKLIFVYPERQQQVQIYEINSGKINILGGGYIDYDLNEPLFVYNNCSRKQGKLMFEATPWKQVIQAKSQYN